MKLFEPIAFAPRFKDVDGKYAVGKFALPSPPDEEDRTEPMIFSSPFLGRNSGWKGPYSVATDPRVGVIRKLIGAKRKSFEQGMRERRSPAWPRRSEEWDRTPSPPLEDSKSDLDSDDEPWMDGDDARTISRPSTPPPSYLPLGPTLLSTHFHHAHLMPLSTPLRPSGLAASTPSSGGVPVSVPTPVSPAAVIGATSEKSKSLEAAAQILAREVVENYVWADAWHVNMNTSPSPPTDVWQSDVKKVVDLLAAVDNAHSPVELETLTSMGRSLRAISVPLSTKLMHVSNSRFQNLQVRPLQRDFKYKTHPCLPWGNPTLLFTCYPPDYGFGRNLDLHLVQGRKTSLRLSSLKAAETNAKHN